MSEKNKDKTIEQEIDTKDNRVYEINTGGGEIHIHVYDCNKVYINSGQPPPPVNPPGGGKP